MITKLVERALLGDGYHVLSAGTGLYLVLACGPSGLETFCRDQRLDQPGIYVSLAETAYCGCGTISVARRARRLAVGGSAGDGLLALVGGEAPFSEGDARVLERVAFQAYLEAGLPLRNVAYPEGRPVGLPRYAGLQRIWAQTVAALREVAPVLARPWQGPEYVSPHPDDGGEDVDPTRWRGKKGATDATIRTCGTGYVLEAGSTIQLDPIESAPWLCWSVREELAFMGVLIREPNCWRLTRDLYLRTRAACSRVAFTSTTTSYWQVVDGNDDLPFTPTFGR